MIATRAFSTLFVALLLACCGAAFAAEVSIYNGQPVSQAGISLGPWGSGRAEETAERALAGGKAIKVTTEGWFAGGSIEFATPVKLFSGKPAANQFLVFNIAPTLQREMATSGADGGWYNRASNKSAGAGGYDFGAESVEGAKIDKLKVVLVSDNGKRSEVTLPVTSPGDTGWIKVGIPLSKLEPAGESGYGLKRLLIFSDIADTIHVGAITVAEDNEPIKVSPGGNVSFAIGDAVVFRANSTAGLSVTRASWDFNDADGIQDDAVGEIVRHVYTKPGDYTVTLKVADVNGLKDAESKTLKVHIE